MINSNNEWDPLKEVIVGNCFNANIPKLDLSIKLFFHDNAYCYYRTDNYRQPIIRQQYIEELNEDIEGFVSVLKNLGIIVYRPQELKKIQIVKTPYWETTTVPALNVRDQFLILGNELFETSPQVRCRYFENDLVRPIIQKQFLENDFKWTVMPKPKMTDNSFDIKYVTNQGPEYKERYTKIPNEFDSGYEMMIDGAQFVRFNTDIIINVANRNHLLGAMWFQKHLDKKYKIHILNSAADNHLDSYIVPLKEGVLLLRDPSFKKYLPSFLDSWKILYPPEPSDNMFPDYKADDFIIGSKYIDMNMLSIDGDKIIVNSLYPEMIKLLDKNGFTPIPVQHRHRRIFSGGFHCFTLDLNRSSI